jgi:F0F1-type ATP synthase assembly protein I
MKDWLPAEGTQLATLFNQPPQYTPPRLPPNQPNNPEVYRSQSQGQSQENKLPTGVIIGIVLLVIGAIGWASDSFTAAQARPFLVIGVFLILGMLTLGKGK